MISILSTRRVALWTRELRRWLSAKFESISIDLTPVEEGIAGVKTDVAGVKTAVENIDFTPIEESITNLDKKISPYLYDECSVEDIERMFETTTEDGLIIVPSGLITPEGTMPISVFKAITGLTPTE